MCSFLITNIKNVLKILDKVNYYQKFRGPDATNYKFIKNILFLHNLLSITGEVILQPFIKNNIVALFNGEIYNYKNLIENDYNSDGECIIDCYLKYGENCFKMFDGEFAIVLFDFKQNKFILSSDVFATKPLFYAFDKDTFAIASYASSVSELGFKNPIKLEANIFKVFNIKNFKLITEETLFKFKLKQYKENFLDWNKAFEDSIKKRATNLKHPLFICLSSGYDSGAICCALNKLGINYSTYSIIGNENLNIINERININNKEYIIYDVSNNDYDFLLNKIKKDAEKYKYKHEKSESGIKKLSEDGASIGNLKIFIDALKSEKKVFLSGSGADEIICDYAMDGKKIFDHSCFNGIYPKNLKDIFPKKSRSDKNYEPIWTSFYEGTQESYLMKEEIISGLAGVEGRYPFLDKYVVQEFLSLTCNLKNSTYKSVIDNYLTENKYPFEKKIKNGYSIKNSKYLEKRNKINEKYKKTKNNNILLLKKFK